MTVHKFPQERFIDGDDGKLFIISAYTFKYISACKRLMFVWVEEGVWKIISYDIGVASIQGRGTISRIRPLTALRRNGQLDDTPHAV